jgi:DEAD/DEAH box helicase domain-containing protein
VAAHLQLPRSEQLENKPKDSSYDEEIKELKGEEAALLTVLQEISKKNVFNFLSDEGLQSVLCT